MARDDDSPLLLELWRELMDHHQRIDPRFRLAPNADDRFLAYLDLARSRDDYRVRVASWDDAPVGFTVACVLPNSPVYRARWIGYINDLCVTSRLRRRGIGRLLVDDATRWLRAFGADTIEVYVAHANTEARAFWRRVGGRDYLERLSLDAPGTDRAEPCPTTSPSSNDSSS